MPGIASPDELVRSIHGPLSILVSTPSVEPAGKSAFQAATDPPSLPTFVRASTGDMRLPDAVTWLVAQMLTACKTGVTLALGVVNVKRNCTLTPTTLVPGGKVAICPPCATDCQVEPPLIVLSQISEPPVGTMEF